MSKALSKKQLKKIDELVAHFDANKNLFDRVLMNIENGVKTSAELQNLTHSFKGRVKDSTHLKDKLIRKAREATSKNKFSITKDNLFTKINDLAGFRIIHLYSKQIKEIDLALNKFFAEEKWEVIEGATARTWDDEMRDFYQKIGIKIHEAKNPNMYTSVHYVVKPNSKEPITCEIQVRTLMEEVWGEVDHLVNYPHKTNSLPCMEQIKVLARATSSCSRLVDSIFFTHEEHGKKKTLKVKKKVAISKKATSKRASKKK